jgi:hypothetical protein
VRSNLLCLAALLVSPLAFAQTPAKPAPPKPSPDVLIFTNGDQLTGKLQGAAGGNVTFASDMAGTLTIAFDKIKEVRSGSSPAEFALLQKGVKIGRKPAIVPEGTAEIAAGKVEIVPAPGTTTLPTSVPAAQVDYLIPKADFDKQVGGKPGFFRAWNGTATGGATLVRSTTTANTFTAALNLIRSIPTVAWLLPRNRTTLNVVETYGKNTSPGAIPQTTPPTPSVTTLSSIFHADSERDEYVSPRLYVLGDIGFDHNYAQGLQLQQTFGAGLGWTPVKSARQQLDLKADVHYEEQRFITAPVNGTVVATTPNLNLIGSTFFEGYRRNLPRKIVFTQNANILPAFNVASAYSANVTAALSLPVFKRFSATFSTTDNYLNDPAPGYNKNSYQFVTGVTYTLR